MCKKKLKKICNDSIVFYLCLPMNDLYKSFIDSNTPTQQNIYSKSITHLLVKNCNQYLNNLPTLITHLTFGNNFNQPINKLPNNIKIIVAPNKLSIKDNNKNYTLTNKKSQYDDDFLELLKNLKGKIIFEELTQKVFHPKKINNLCDKHNIYFELYIDLI